MHAPRISHWQAVKRILCYLKHISYYGLYLCSAGSPSLTTFLDADWASYPDDRRSIGGQYVFFGSNLISWTSRKQPPVARPSTEVEYKCVANTTAELIWVQFLLSELSVFLQKPPILWCDNLGVTYLSVNPVLHSCTKHVDIDVHFVHDLVANRSLTVSFFSSTDQLADIFSKLLSISCF